MIVSAWKCCDTKIIMSYPSVRMLRVQSQQLSSGFPDILQGRTGDKINFMNEGRNARKILAD